jgi:hypothetical protein
MTDDAARHLSREGLGALEAELRELETEGRRAIRPLRPPGPEGARRRGSARGRVVAAGKRYDGWYHHLDFGPRCP